MSGKFHDVQHSYNRIPGRREKSLGHVIGEIIEIPRNDGHKFPDTRNPPASFQGTLSQSFTCWRGERTSRSLQNVREMSLSRRPATGVSPAHLAGGILSRALSLAQLLTERKVECSQFTLVQRHLYCPPRLTENLLGMC